MIMKDSQQLLKILWSRFTQYLILFVRKSIQAKLTVCIARFASTMMGNIWQQVAMQLALISSMSRREGRLIGLKQVLPKRYSLGILRRCCWPTLTMARTRGSHWTRLRRVTFIFFINEVALMYKKLNFNCKIPIPIKFIYEQKIFRWFSL